ncbi:MAG: winged helix-turn-helix transcriptional regulator [Deltaproteobacteria bacterium]|jgi:ArsR family transcriptional regulator|nr:winged helix-turn-helix transcriptional regulator [Deltaproteobacteria bacterium]MBW2651923.1 winged helix-turn-helix transcriptional regulator [Deltaproteobacteria bacterium]NOQ86372.1 metalloregulator ArsR/SmtB family transcription factor [Deltaproteobacteria bacterium]
MEEFVNFFKGLSDRTRLRTIWLLNKANTRLCVCEIMDSLNENQYNVSRHLKVLKSAGFLKEEKEGRWVYYSLINPKNRFQELILEAVSALPEESFEEISERLKERLSFRKNGKCVAGMKSEECYKI